MADAVNHPPHYTAHPSGLEAIDLCEQLTFSLGNALKYVWRAGLKTKDPVEDLKKARWYLVRELQPPRRTLRQWLDSFLGMFLPPRRWLPEFEHLRKAVIAADMSPPYARNLITRFLSALGDGSDRGVNDALVVIDEELEKLESRKA